MIEDITNILDKIDIEERKMLRENAKLRTGASEYLILDKISYNALKYERGINEDSEMSEYHGYTISVVDKYEEYIRFV